MAKSTPSPQKSVLVVPEFGITRILRGYSGFEDQYQGKNVFNNVIWLSDRKDGKDPQAAVAFKKLQAQVDKNGGVIPGGGLTDNDTAINPWFQRGIPVPIGATIILYLPYSAASGSSGGTPYPLPFRYVVAWRNRSSSVNALARQPYHSAFDGLGQPDNGSNAALTATGISSNIFSGAATARRVIQAFWEPLRYAQAEPAGGDISTEDVWANSFRTNPSSDLSLAPQPPLFPYFKTVPPAPNPTYGSIGQGAIKNNTLDRYPNYVPISLKVKGDEMMIGVMLDTSFAPVGPAITFDFDANAYLLSLLFGRAGFVTGNAALAPPLVPNKSLGVFVTTGSSS